jgi:hypothetical protein
MVFVLVVADLWFFNQAVSSITYTPQTFPPFKSGSENGSRRCDRANHDAILALYNRGLDLRFTRLLNAQ